MSALTMVRKFFPQVESVVDATRQAPIEVTKRDAEAKGKKDHTACALAVACKRKFHLDGVLISRCVAYLVKGKQARRFHVPHSISREVVSYDRGAEFSPGQYVLKAVPIQLRFGVKVPGNKRKREHTKNQRFRHVTNKIRTTLSGEHEQPEG